MKLTRRNFLKLSLFSIATASIKGCWPSNLQSQQKKTKKQPAYASLEKEGKFKERIEKAYQRMASCSLCPHNCHVNRLKGEKGFCNAPDKAIISSYNPHYGEELPLVGKNGSGTIFFANCNLRCVFCQNWPIAHQGRGYQVNDEQLAKIMLDLQKRGCHNINLVTPTHVMPNALAATRIALKRGLRIPLCYNTGGYESVENIKLLDGIVDIYLPDLKFMDKEKANQYVFTGAHNYPKKAQEAIIEMHRQVGDLITDKDGIALQGVMLRHLVMPNHVSGAYQFVNWVAKNLSTDTYVNLMSQYRVEHKAYEYEKISRAINQQEFAQAIKWAKEAGLTNLDKRSISHLERFRRMFR